jgi:hypothetical protein
MFLIFTCDVYAESCDSDDIKRLRVLASNIEITYEYNDNIYDSDGLMIYDTYNVFINNLTDELYVVETNTSIVFKYNGDVSKAYLVPSGKKTFKVYSNSCDTVLKTLYVTLPRFNYYSTDSNCEGREDLEVCGKFYDSSNLDYSEFLSIIVEDENSSNNNSNDDNIKDDGKDRDSNNKYIDFIKDNYIYCGIGIIVFILIIVLLILRHKKRGVLE